MKNVYRSFKARTKDGVTQRDIGESGLDGHGRERE